jgi:hypothetical protein
MTLLTINSVTIVLTLSTDKTDVNLPETAFEKNILEYAKSQSQNKKNLY